MYYAGFVAWCRKNLGGFAVAFFLDSTQRVCPLVLTGRFDYNAPNEEITETHDQGHEAAGESA